MMMLVDEQVRTTVRKNTATSYGLTLVAGLPFPAKISSQIRRVQEQLDLLTPGQCTWYGADHLHTTLNAPLRGRYREQPPLQRSELPSDLQGCIQDLNVFFAQRAPFPLHLAGVRITADGSMLIGEDTLMRQLAATLRTYPEIDHPKHIGGLHVVIGFLHTHQPFLSAEASKRFERKLAGLSNITIGQVTVQRVWLVHYAKRTLSHIVGKVPFTLGQVNHMTSEELMRALGILANPK
jgi:hypothetical protein